MEEQWYQFEVFNRCMAQGASDFRGPFHGYLHRLLPVVVLCVVSVLNINMA